MTLDNLEGSLHTIVVIR